MEDQKTPNEGCAVQQKTERLGRYGIPVDENGTNIGDRGCPVCGMLWGHIDALHDPATRRAVIRMVS